MPQLGQTATGAELGKTRKTARFIWYSCPKCDKERWVELDKGKPEYDLCRACSNKIISTGRKQENNNNWKGGVHYSGGRILIHQPNHPRANTEGYVKRAIIVLERKLGRPLLLGMDCHHINNIKDDDSPNNLMELAHGDHTLLHTKKRG